MARKTIDGYKRFLASLGGSDGKHLMSMHCLTFSVSPALAGRFFTSWAPYLDSNVNNNFLKTNTNCSLDAVYRIMKNYAI